MKKTSLYKYNRTLYYIFTLIILVLSIYKTCTSSIVLYLDDYIFLLILILSFILVNRFSIKLKDTYLNFNDFIILIFYVKFNINIYLTVLFLLLNYSLIFAIEYKNSNLTGKITDNKYIFNNCLVISSVFLSHVLLNIIDNIYYIQDYDAVIITIFTLFLLIINYFLYCIDLSLQRNRLMLITFESGLYYILFNSMLCTVLALFGIYLEKQYGYVPIITMTTFIIFISFSLNNLNRLKANNSNLKAISDCTTFMISNTDFKVKLQYIVQTIEQLVPFVYCGIYFFRDKYSHIYPLSYKNNTLLSLNDLKFSSTTDSSIYYQIISGNIIYKGSTTFASSINIVNMLPKDIKYSVAIPVKNSDFVTGFIFLCLDRYREINDELELLSTLGYHLGMVNFNINTNAKSNIISYKSYDGLLRYIDYNIKYKIFFTLAALEIINYEDIINKFNRDFYETFKAEIGKLISKFLSSEDNILCFEKESIYIVFNLLDTKNALNKLQEISEFLKNFRYKDMSLNAQITYATSEYPFDGINSDEILAVIYRKLHNQRNA